VTHSDKVTRVPGEVSKALDENRKRRNRAAREVDEAREELAELLVEGKALRMTVTAMAATAKVSRKYAHELLNEVRARGDDN
jgi:hypothetical protein